MSGETSLVSPDFFYSGLGAGARYPRGRLWSAAARGSTTRNTLEVEIPQRSAEAEVETPQRSRYPRGWPKPRHPRGRGTPEVGRSRSAPNLPQIQEASEDLENGRAWDAEADVEESAGHAAHDVSDRNADQEGRSDALDHNESRTAEPVVKADKAEEEACQEAVDPVSFEVVEAGGDNFRVAGEDAAQEVPMKEGQPEHYCPESGRQEDCYF